MKLSKTSALSKLQQRGNRSSVTSPPHPLPASSSSSSSSSPAAADLASVPDSLSVVESRVCRQLMVDKFNRVSAPRQFLQFTADLSYLYLYLYFHFKYLYLYLYLYFHLKYLYLYLHLKYLYLYLRLKHLHLYVYLRRKYLYLYLHLKYYKITFYWIKKTCDVHIFLLALLPP